nr:immunoglobulin light chain junction region [Macaca mulatta]MOW02536.1 immunoglobulin light chain junction region [Macaca mulatta]MOW02628.1 immunoglobulin light chain junction region [Macaca mulatta]MOW02840.1 immunoglobulin light chain junction region [Macaca mulatta]
DYYCQVWDIRSGNYIF